MGFKENYDENSRYQESNKILLKYPTRVPIIVEKQNGFSDIPDIDRHKFLVPNEISMAEFMYVIRKRIRISPEKSIFLFVENL